MTKYAEVIEIIDQYIDDEDYEYTLYTHSDPKKYCPQYAYNLLRELKKEIEELQCEK